MTGHGVGMTKTLSPDMRARDGLYVGIIGDQVLQFLSDKICEQGAIQVDVDRLSELFDMDDYIMFRLVESLKHGGLAIGTDGWAGISPQGARKAAHLKRDGDDLLSYTRKNSFAKKLLQYIRTMPNGRTKKEILEHFPDNRYNTIENALNRYCNNGVLEKDGLPRARNARYRFVNATSYGTEQGTGLDVEPEDKAETILAYLRLEPDVDTAAVSGAVKLEANYVSWKLCKMERFLMVCQTTDSKTGKVSWKVNSGYRT